MDANLEKLLTSGSPPGDRAADSCSGSLLERVQLTSGTWLVEGRVESHITRERVVANEVNCGTRAKLARSFLTAFG